MTKPTVLVFAGHYLPGHKAGGIIRTVINTVDHLSDRFDFRVVTTDRDLGDDVTYPGVETNRWTRVGNALVYYLAPSDRTIAKLTSIINEHPGAVLYLNSFFDPLTVKVLAAARLGRLGKRRIIVAPRGEFAWASLGQKYPKKLVFMLAARLIGLYRRVVWHASSKFEGDDIIKVMKVDPRSIHVAFDFAIKEVAVSDDAHRPASADSDLQVVYLSRVAREKKLDYALRVLRRVQSKVRFDIYGPTADAAYWADCQRLIGELPSNIAVRYCGVVAGGDVVDVFSRYDLFFFPTGGEAFGHAMAESLLAGTPLLTSRETPWRDLPADRLGWDLSLDQPELFAQVIDELAAVPPDRRRASRADVRAGVARRLADPAIAESHISLLLGPR